MTPDDIDIDQIIDDEEIYNDRILDALALLSQNSDESSNSEYSESQVGSNKVKLPVISLPEFSNEKGESLEKFLYSFEAILNKHKLSPYEKFVYLKGQVRKAPFTLIDSLDISDQTYDNAKQLLAEAFASPLAQKYDAIMRLSQLKLDLNGDPYEFIGSVRSVQSSFNVLEIDVNTIIQYFVWRGLNDNFQSELVNITNNSRPTLDEITGSYFVATERYTNKINRMDDMKKRQTKIEPKAESVNNSRCDSKLFATQVKPKPFGTCNLCFGDKNKDHDHLMKDCPVYLTPYDKVQKLKSLKFCSRCGFRNHCTLDCRFSFVSKCKNCNRDHMTYLCLKPRSSGSSHNHSTMSKL